MKVLTLGDELLRQKSLPVEEVTPEIKALAEVLSTNNEIQSVCSELRYLA